MNRRVVHHCGRLLMVFQIVLLGADFAHSDSLVIGGLPEAIQNHTCGTREIHKPLDSVLPCLPCYRTTHSLAVADATAPGVPVVRTPLTYAAPFLLSSVNASHLVPKRGPPR